MAAPKVVRNNPNASVAAGGTGAGVAVVAIVSAAGVDISPELSALITGGISTGLLFVGKRGVKGAIDQIWKGDDEK